ncbi:hypothetical protein [Victivallis vadensis]|uniref:NinB protein n=1 Tax=Victivallis vadensis TaxID=172901 RepID=A0A848AR03_9BACT|nr:hypothetical protein [Victivallis vadensis]NMD86264.1 hypothetical protein [Victivallis vadensis]
MRVTFRLEHKEETAADIAAAIARTGKVLPPGEYRVVIEPVTKERTNEQNRFYWAVLNEIAEATGNGNEDLHEHFRARFLQDRSCTPARIRSTTELSVREFTRYIDQILEFVGTQYGITVSLSREF